MKKCSKVRKTRNSVADIEIDTSIVGKRSLLHLIKGNAHQTGDPPWHDLHEKSYPVASTHYVFHAESDPSNRLQELGRNSPVEPHFPPPSLVPYSEEEARAKYLESKPTCYIVFGKPGLQTETLAEAIAVERKCILISATKFLNELDDKESFDDTSKPGSNLTCGCGSKEEAVWNFIIAQVDSKEANHRGYVIEGLPLIQNETTSIEDTSQRATAVVEQPKEPIKSNDYVAVCMHDPVSSEKLSERERSEKSLDLSNCESYKNSSSTTKVSSACECASSTGSTRCGGCSVSFQMQEVFRNWQMKPDIIVNIACSDEDILPTDAVDTSSSSSGVEHSEKQSEVVNSVSSKSFNSFCDNIHFSNQKNFTVENLKKQLEYYSSHAVSIIESFIVNHNPQNVISIDGRYPLDHIISTVNLRLQLIPLLPTVVVPEKISTDFEDSGEGGEYENDSLENLSDHDLSDQFQKLKNVGVASDKFLWKLSRWGFLCPVELARGKRVEGKQNYSVRFMSWIFFLSSLEAMDIFMKNPRPFLVPPNPRPSCRMLVVGPRHSGKAVTSKALARDFDSVLIDVREIMNTYFDLDEKVIRIVMEVENLSEKYYGGYFRDRGWILDGMNLDFEVCKRLLESDVNIETVVVLCESEPFTYLLKHWWDKFPEKRSNCEAESICKSISGEFEHSIFGVENVDLAEYVESLRYFNEQKTAFVDNLKRFDVNVIECDYKYVENPAEHAIYQVRKNYNFVPRFMEATDAEDENENEEGSEISESETLRNQEPNFKLGDCNSYCPVALMDHKILWKGKSYLRCLLDDKIYSLSSENAMEKFINDYAKLNLPVQKPFNPPPFRIFIVGPPGSGKSTIGRMIAKEFGLAYVDFISVLDNYLKHRNVNVDELKSRLLSMSAEEEIEDDDFHSLEDWNHFKFHFEQEVISSFYLKYLSVGAIIPAPMIKECLLKFFDSPFDQCGLLIDTFPYCPKDSKVIFEKFLIPDVIIELKCDQEDSEKRLFPLMMQQWQNEQDKLRDKEHAKFNVAMDEYLTEKFKWIRQKKIELYKQRKWGGEEESDNNSGEEDESDSVIAENYDFSIIVTDDDEIELEDLFAAKFKPPKMVDDFETEDSAKERFYYQIEERYDRSAQNLFLLFNFFENETVPWLEIDAKASINDVFLRILYALTPYFRRNFSFFEKTLEIDNFLAESLLASGYYFLSPFGRFCPVQLYNSKNPIQMFVPLLSKNEIFTVLHRQYVYFIAGKRALDDFKRDPLKYLNQDSHMPLIPAIISVIGPPKCGKTTLSKRFSSTYDFEVITKNEAIHYVLNNFPSSHLSTCIKTTIHEKECVTPDLLAEAVKLFTSNPGCIAQGCIFDGFPDSIEETKALVKFAIAPIVVIDLEANFEFTVECNEPEESLEEETNSDIFFAHKNDFCLWEVDAEIFRQWMVKNFANVVKIDATKTKAAVWQRADESVRHRLTCVLKYVRDVGYDKAHELEYLCVTPDEIEARVSRFGLYCPECIRASNEFNELDVSTGRKGLVQYREHFYWLCESHLETFKRKPSWRLNAYDKVVLPDEYPKKINDFIDLDNYCWSSRLKYNGFCPVVYFDNLPRRKLVPGKLSCGIFYNNGVYLCSSEDHRDKFCRYFLKYTESSIHYPQVLEKLDPQKMPNLGFLEQKVARVIVQAVSRVALLRPKIPGLSASTSAAVFVGSYLKAIVGTIESPKYEAAVRRIESRCALFKLVAENMKKTVRPRVVADIHSVDEKVERSRKSPSILDMAVVKFKRTSPSQIIIDSDDSSQN